MNGGRNVVAVEQVVSRATRHRRKLGQARGAAISAVVTLELPVFDTPRQRSNRAWSATAARRRSRYNIR